jgi:hypothetical protein
MDKNLFARRNLRQIVAVTFFLKVRFKNAAFASGEMKPE